MLGKTPTLYHAFSIFDDIDLYFGLEKEDNKNYINNSRLQSGYYEFRDVDEFYRENRSVIQVIILKRVNFYVNF